MTRVPAVRTGTRLTLQRKKQHKFSSFSRQTVGYTLPGNLTSKWGISKARFYVSASNLFIITGYSGYDPEVDIQTGLTCGMDYNRYPRSRSFVLGTNITF